MTGSAKHGSPDLAALKLKRLSTGGWAAVFPPHDSSDACASLFAELTRPPQPMIRRSG